MKQKYSKKEAQQQKRKEKKKDAGKGFGCRGAGLRREWGLGRCGEGAQDNWISGEGEGETESGSEGRPPTPRGLGPGGVCLCSATSCC